MRRSTPCGRVGRLIVSVEGSSTIMVSQILQIRQTAQLLPVITRYPGAILIWHPDLFGPVDSEGALCSDIPKKYCYSGFDSQSKELRLRLTSGKQICHAHDHQNLI
jgi:hypothetical protein